MLTRLTKNWNDFVNLHNDIQKKIIDVTGSKDFPRGSILKAKNNVVIDLGLFSARLNSVLFKLNYANLALQKFSPESELMKKASQTFLISNELLFNIDVFFSFSYSALDVVAWIPHLVYGLNFDDKHVDFHTIVDYLASPKRGKIAPFVQLTKSKKDTGWIGQFNNYRNYVTHYGVLSNDENKFSFNEGITKFQIFLPDNPKVERYPTFRKEREVYPYCDYIHAKTLETVTQIYKNIIKFL